MITLEKFEGHIVLYCKNHYNIKNVDFIVGLQRIWAVRCGLQIEHINHSINEYIADHLHEIFVKCNPKKQEYFYQILFKGLVDEWRYKKLNPIERVIMIYANELAQLQIKETNPKFKDLLINEVVKKKLITLIKLPKPQKQLFKRIVNGGGKYGDYNLVK